MSDEPIKRVEEASSLNDFMGTPHGRRMAELCHEVVEMVKDKLLKTDPTNTEAIRTLQNQAQVAEQALRWMERIADDGEAALREMSEAINNVY